MSDETVFVWWSSLTGDAMRLVTGFERLEELLAHV